MTEDRTNPHAAGGLMAARLAQAGWQRLHTQQAEPLAAEQHLHGLDLSPIRGRAATQEGEFIVIPMELVVCQQGEFRETVLVLALGKEQLISVEQGPALHALDRASEQLLTRLTDGGALGPGTMMLYLLEALNDAAHASLRAIAERLDERSDAVAAASGGFDTAQRQAGVADIAGTAMALAEAEELVAKAVEGQLMLARAGRWLRRAAEDARLGPRLTVLLADIHSLRRYARFQHDKIRNLQQSLMTTLDIKQNQVIKVFTVVTAVFTPPTLVAAFYGQNFAYMPELALPWGEWMVMGLTGLFALVPLAYIKRKGWMR